jgi:translation elongation factor aEF-1 beta
MSEVIVGLKVMPSTVDVDLDILEKKIREKINPDKIARQPIAYGLVAFLVTKFILDGEGELEKLENMIKSIENVGEVEITGLTRSL